MQILSCECKVKFASIRKFINYAHFKIAQVLMFLVHRLHGICITMHIHRCRGHAVRTSVFSTCSLHKAVPPLVDACVVWPGIGKPLNFNSKVLSSACTATRSMG